MQEKLQSLKEIQSELNDLTTEYLEEDFKLKLTHHKKMIPFFQRRDKMLREEVNREDVDELINKALEEFTPFRDLFPMTGNSEYDSSILEFFKAEYLDDFKVKVTMEFKENKYIENKILEKTINFFECESDSTPIIWKERVECPLFDFFESHEDDFEAFDIIYEFYTDLLFLAGIECE